MNTTYILRTQERYIYFDSLSAYLRANESVENKAAQKIKLLAIHIEEFHL